MALLTCFVAFEFPRRGLACCARPSSARENVGHLPRRNAIRPSSRSIDSSLAHRTTY
jgi:hypothetical protein